MVHRYISQPTTRAMSPANAEECLCEPFAMGPSSARGVHSSASSYPGRLRSLSIHWRPHHIQLTGKVTRNRFAPVEDAEGKFRCSECKSFWT